MRETPAHLKEERREMRRGREGGREGEREGGREGGRMRLCFFGEGCLLSLDRFSNWVLLRRALSGLLIV